MFAGVAVQAGDNAVIVGHSLTSNSNVHEWWGELMGAGPAFCLDTTSDFIVCANYLGSPYGRGGTRIHFSPDARTLCGVLWVYWVVPVTKSAHVKPNRGGVYAPGTRQHVAGVGRPAQGEQRRGGVRRRLPEPRHHPRQRAAPAHAAG